MDDRIIALFVFVGALTFGFLIGRIFGVVGVMMVGTLFIAYLVGSCRS